MSNWSINNSNYRSCWLRLPCCRSQLWPVLQNHRKGETRRDQENISPEPRWNENFWLTLLARHFVGSSPISFLIYYIISISGCNHFIINWILLYGFNNLLLISPWILGKWKQRIIVSAVRLKSIEFSFTTSEIRGSFFLPLCRCSNKTLFSKSSIISSKPVGCSASGGFLSSFA